MLKKLRLFLAQRALKNSLNHEEMLRTSAEYMRNVIIPRHEMELERAEIEFMSDSFFDGKM